MKHILLCIALMSVQLHGADGKTARPSSSGTWHAACTMQKAGTDTSLPETVFSLLKEGNGMTLYLMCDSMMQQAMNISMFNTLWTQLEAQAGKYVSHGQWNSYPGVERAFWSNVRFERTEMALLLVFNTEGKVSGLRIIPAMKEPGSTGTGEEGTGSNPLTGNGMDAENAGDAKIKETECKVVTGKRELPAVLTEPVKESAAGTGLAGYDRTGTPVVIFVHGSGPNGMDEAIGPNKIFKELAEGLASHGIASLRYDKRTLVYGKGAFSDPGRMTLEEETIDDAVSAARLAASLGYRHIFILGHSLGAGCAPLIAMQCSGRDPGTEPPQAGREPGQDDSCPEETAGISGMIMMAAPARPMMEMIDEQIKVISPYNSPEAVGQLRASMEAIPENYIEEVDYDRLPVIKEIVKKGIPALILQGERDYQVTMEDFGIWKETFRAACGHEVKKAAGAAEGTAGSGAAGKGCDTYTDFIMKSYPGLNHIFHKGEGAPSPAEYMEKGQIPEQVISDIAGFIHDMSGRHTSDAFQAARHNHY